MTDRNRVLDFYPTQPDFVLFKKSVIKVIRKYVTPSTFERLDLDSINLKDHADIAEHIQKIFAIRGEELRMYGSPEEFCDQLKEFMNFSASHRVFKLDNCEPYFTLPEVLIDDGNNEHISKVDLLNFMHNLVRLKYNSPNNFCRSLIAVLLKHNESALDNTQEYIKCNMPDSMFSELQNHFEAYYEATEELIGERMAQLNFDDSDLEDVKTNVFELCRHEGATIDHFWSASNELDLFLRNVSPDQYCATVKTCYLMECSVRRTLKEMLEHFAPLFLPISNVRNDRNFAHWSPDSMGLRNYVRVFEKNGHKFLLEDEMFKAMGRVLRGRSGFLRTIPFTEGKEMMERNDTVFTLLKADNRVTHHPRMFIWNSCGVAHKFATNVFFELFEEWVFGIQLFQKIKTADDWSLVEQFFEKFSMQFDVDEKNPYLLSEESIEQIFACSKTVFSGISARPAKPISSARGFTKYELIAEIGKLELRDAFPDILEHVEFVFREIDKNKKRGVWRDCDLFDALRTLQMICFFRKYHSLTEFLHNQHDCFRLLLRNCCGRRDKGTSLKRGIPMFEEDTVSKRAHLAAIRNFEEKAVQSQEKVNSLNRRLNEYEKRHSVELQTNRKLKLQITGHRVSEKSKKLRIAQLLAQLQGAEIPIPLSAEMQRKVAELEARLENSRVELETVQNKVALLKQLFRTDIIHEFADTELRNFANNTRRYQNSIQHNIDVIKSNPLVTHYHLRPLLEAPELSDQFNEQYALAEEENNQLDSECQICFTPLSDEDEIWTCPAGGHRFHAAEIRQWFAGGNRSCPTCRR